MEGKAMMMLLIGSNFLMRRASCVVRKTQYAKRKAQYGFTLVEVMVATAILSFGLVMIYQAFIISLDAFGYSLNHLNAQLWLDEKIWQIQDEFRRYEYFNPIPTSGELIMGNKIFYWNMGYGLIEPEELFKVNLNVSWQEGTRKVQLSRSAYVSHYVSETE
jgi:prepilin-type N-terminal cleavage/methylation domain-containing protein